MIWLRRYGNGYQHGGERTRDTHPTMDRDFPDDGRVNSSMAPTSSGVKMWMRMGMMPMMKNTVFFMPPTAIISFQWAHSPTDILFIYGLFHFWRQISLFLRASETPANISFPSTAWYRYRYTLYQWQKSKDHYYESISPPWNDLSFRKRNYSC